MRMALLILLHRRRKQRIPEFPILFYGTLKTLSSPFLKEDIPLRLFFLPDEAYGVLPPVAKIKQGEQAMYHYLSGYTAKVAGTELGTLRNRKPYFLLVLVRHF